METRRPPWNKFDTFLRRAAMIGVVLLVWTTIVAGTVASSFIISNVTNTHTTDVPAVDTWTGDQSQWDQTQSAN